MTRFFARPSERPSTSTPSPAANRREEFENAVAAFRKATGKPETRIIPCRCAVKGEPFAIVFERMSPAHRFQIVRIEGYEATQESAGGMFGRKPPQQSYAAGEFAWTGCVCPHCGNRGVVYCNSCRETVCAGRVWPLPDGGTFFACHDGCGATGTTGPATHVPGGAGASRPAISHAPQLPAPSAAGKRLPHDIAPRLPGRQPK